MSSGCEVTGGRTPREHCAAALALGRLRIAYLEHKLASQPSNRSMARRYRRTSMATAFEIQEAFIDEHK